MTFEESKVRFINTYLLRKVSVDAEMKAIAALDALIAAAREEQREEIARDLQDWHHNLATQIRTASLTATPLADEIARLKQALEAALWQRDAQSRDAQVWEVEAKTLADRIRELESQVAGWQEKAKVWLASPEAAKRLDGYRELAEKCAALEGELEQALARYGAALAREHALAQHLRHARAIITSAVDLDAHPSWRVDVEAWLKAAG